jgi:hypothetical protein
MTLPCQVAGVSIASTPSLTRQNGGACELCVSYTNRYTPHSIFFFGIFFGHLCPEASLVLLTCFVFENCHWLDPTQEVYARTDVAKYQIIRPRWFRRLASMDDEVPAETELPAGAAMLRDTVVRTSCKQ